MKNFILSIFVAVALGALCRTSHAEGTNTELACYILRSEKTDGSILFDAFPFPKLGYVASKPDLVITRLKEVNLVEKRAYATFSEDQKTGKRRKATIHPAPQVYFTLLDEDAAKVKALAGSAPEERFLVTFNGKPISLRRMSAVAEKAAFHVAHNSTDTTKLKQTEEELRKLVSE